MCSHVLWLRASGLDILIDLKSSDYQAQCDAFKSKCLDLVAPFEQPDGVNIHDQSCCRWYESNHVHDPDRFAKRPKMVLCSRLEVRLLK